MGLYVFFVVHNLGTCARNLQIDGSGRLQGSSVFKESAIVLLFPKRISIPLSFRGICYGSGGLHVFQVKE